MIDPKAYLDALIPRLKTVFAERLAYVGLQGSYLRGEAHEGSDIDIMLVVENLSVADMDTYRQIISQLDFPEKSCGFICSKADLAHWNPLEIFHVLNSTRDCYGPLSNLIPEYSRQDVIHFIKYSLNNLYHEICHRYIHADREKSVANLPFSLKGVFFILQNLHWLRTGNYISTKSELLAALTGKDRQVLQMSIEIPGSGAYDFDACFECLFSWCQETLASL